jgi:hypothetical protein
MTLRLRVLARQPGPVPLFRPTLKIGWVPDAKARRASNVFLLCDGASLEVVR